jgi:hypothetical protein
MDWMNSQFDEFELPHLMLNQIKLHCLSPASTFCLVIIGIIGKFIQKLLKDPTIAWLGLGYRKLNLKLIK